MAGDYHEIGLLLRQARESFGLNAHEVAQALHIRVMYIEAMEEGQFKHLPGAAYARGYLQSYAEFLQLDQREIMRRFGQIEKQLQRGFFLPNVLSREKKPGSEAVWGGLIAAAVLYLLWIGLNHYDRVEAPIVDMPPSMLEQMRKKSAGMPYHSACFQSQDLLYPPCHVMTRAAARIALPKSPVKSVMDLANFKNAN